MFRATGHQHRGSMTRSFFTAALFVAVTVVAPSADQQTWTGQISDSACGKQHEEAAEGQGKMPDKECTEACVRGGSQYVLVVDGKVFKLTNQTNPDLKANAGRSVKLTGELKGDSITVSKVEAIQ
jgi:hypothetical protein